MREILFKTLTLDGNSVEESKIVVDEDEMLIMQPTYEMTFEELYQLHKLMERALRDNSEMVTLHYGIEFKTLKITE